MHYRSGNKTAEIADDNVTNTIVGFLLRCEAAQTDGVDHFVFRKRARDPANFQKRIVSCSLSNNGRRLSAVTPECPAAALLATRMFFAKMSWSRENHGPRRSKRSSRRSSRAPMGV